MFALKPFACHPNASRGRLWPEPDSKHRTCHQRDRDRIIHSGAFRRLQYKTQVFVYHEGDFFRTRLTHSLEVAQITRSLARTLGLNEDLAETVALAHDLGHTPFAHAGEDELNALMAAFGGFDHNDQAIRVLTQLEQRYPDFDGLNLTWESLEGVVKHNGPLLRPDGTPLRQALPTTIAAFQANLDLWLDSYPSAEAQVAALADDIAYTNHDIDDGIRSGLISLDDLRQVPVIDTLLRGVQASHPNLRGRRLVLELVRRLFDQMAQALLSETTLRLTTLNPGSADDIRRAKHAVVAFPERYWLEQIVPLRRFLYDNVYRHWRVNRMRRKVRQVIREMFELFVERPNTLPDDWRISAIQSADMAGKARIVADYIAGMTDRYAMEEHKRLFDPFERT